MRRVLRIVDTGVRPSRWNVAASAALAESGDEGLLRFHRYVPCVLLGNGQKFADAARKGPWEIARRVTGGGAVYMDPGILAWDLFVDGRDPKVFAATVGKAITSAVTQLGVRADYVSPHDVRVGGEKISGSSGLVAGARLMLQGTLVATLDREAFAKSLVMPGPVRVASLSEFLTPLPPMDAILEAVADALCAALNRDAAPGDLTDAENAAIDATYRGEIGTDVFVFGTEASCAAS
ncbi:MAG: lipoate--protein ligase family protein [Alphaproteobacteria bacterium]|nr:lipoate--protein ligase family protein [Alphaproteobacteria bacterium]